MLEKGRRPDEQDLGRGRWLRGQCAAPGPGSPHLQGGVQRLVQAARGGAGRVVGRCLGQQRAVPPGQLLVRSALLAHLRASGA